MPDYDTADPAHTPAPAGKRWRYHVGYYCPRGNGHFELYENDEYDSGCGSKGWDLYLDAEPGDTSLPEGVWRLVFDQD